MWFSDNSGRAVDVEFFAGAGEWQSKTTQFKIGHKFLPLPFFQRIPTTRQRHRYVDSKFSHFVRLPPSVTVLCPNLCRRIISDLIDIFISYFGRRRCQYDTLIFQFIEIEDLGVTHRQPERRQAIVGLNLKNHDSYLEFIDTVIHKFANVLETMDDEDQGWNLSDYLEL